jgi:hypothetical protein
MVTKAGDIRAIEGDPLDTNHGTDQITTMPVKIPPFSPESEETIRALYAEFFGREPDEGGLAYFAGLLDQGADISDIIAGMASSAEAADVGVQKLEGLQFGKPEDRAFYESFDVNKDRYLSPSERRRFAEATGQEFIPGTKDFASAKDREFLSSFDKDQSGYLSPEEKRYYNEAIGKDASADQIKQLYQDMFGREADEAGLEYWDKTGAGLDEIRREFGKSREAQDLAAKKTVDTGDTTMRGDRVGKGVPVTGENSGLRDPYVDYVQTMLQRASAEADVPFQAYTKTPELITQATSGLKNLVTPGQFTAGSNLAQAAGLGALTYGNYQPTQYATGTFANPFVGQQAQTQQTQPPPGKAEGGVVEYQAGGDVNVGSDSSQQSAYTNNMNYGMGTTGAPGLQPMVYGGQNVTNVQASYMDPYMQNVTNIAKREAQRASDIASQREAAQAVSQGAFGGSRYGLVEAERQRNLGQQLSDLDIKGLQAAYSSGMGQFNTEQERALKAQELGEKSRQFGADLGLRGLQTSIQAGTALGNLGAQQNTADIARLRQQYDTGAAERAFDYNEFLRGEKYPYENLTFMRNMLQNLPIQAASTGISPNTEAITAALAALGIINKP